MESTRDVDKDLNEGRYIVGSYFYNEESSWGWKYGFTLNNEITIAQLHELTEVIETYLNKNIFNK